MKRILLAGVVVVAAAAVFVAATSGPRRKAESRPGTFAFAVLGDAPYYSWEEIQFRLVLRDIDANDLAFVVHVGDIFSKPCTDEHYGRIAGWLAALRHPVLYTPGDNEWVDCWEPASGAFRPAERLAKLRQVFFADPTHAFGGESMPVASQMGQERFAEFVENARWTKDGIVFATVHITGTDNGKSYDPVRTAEDDESLRRRTRAATDWLRQAFGAAAETGATGVVVALHANVSLEQPADAPERAVFEPFLTALEEEAERFPGAVVVLHGDGHEYLVDRPLARRTTGERLENVTRVQVPGSPEVGWVRVVATPGPVPSFEFEPRVVPRWKYW